MSPFITDIMLVGLLTRRKIDFQTYHGVSGEYCLKVVTKDRLSLIPLNDHALVTDLYQYVLENYPLEDV